MPGIFSNSPRTRGFLPLPVNDIDPLGVIPSIIQKIQYKKSQMTSTVYKSESRNNSISGFLKTLFPENNSNAEINTSERSGNLSSIYASSALSAHGPTRRNSSEEKIEERASRSTLSLYAPVPEEEDGSGVGSLNRYTPNTRNFPIGNEGDGFGSKPSESVLSEKMDYLQLSSDSSAHSNSHYASCSSSAPSSHRLKGTVEGIDSKDGAKSLRSSGSIASSKYNLGSDVPGLSSDLLSNSGIAREKSPYKNITHGDLENKWYVTEELKCSDGSGVRAFNESESGGNGNKSGMSFKFSRDGYQKNLNYRENTFRRWINKDTGRDIFYKLKDNMEKSKFFFKDKINNYMQGATHYLNSWRTKVHAFEKDKNDQEKLAEIINFLHEIPENFKFSSGVLLIPNYDPSDFFQKNMVGLSRKAFLFPPSVEEKRLADEKVTPDINDLILSVFGSDIAEMMRKNGTNINDGITFNNYRKAIPKEFADVAKRSKIILNEDAEDILTYMENEEQDGRILLLTKNRDKEILLSTSRFRNGSKSILGGIQWGETIDFDSAWGKKIEEMQRAAISKKEELIQKASASQEEVVKNFSKEEVSSVASIPYAENRIPFTSKFTESFDIKMHPYTSPKKGRDVYSNGVAKNTNSLSSDELKPIDFKLNNWRDEMSQALAKAAVAAAAA